MKYFLIISFSLIIFSCKKNEKTTDVYFTFLFAKENNTEKYFYFKLTNNSNKDISIPINNECIMSGSQLKQDEIFLFYLFPNNKDSTIINNLISKTDFYHSLPSFEYYNLIEKSRKNIKNNSFIYFRCKLVNSNSIGIIKDSLNINHLKLCLKLKYYSKCDSSGCIIKSITSNNFDYQIK